MRDIDVLVICADMNAVLESLVYQGQLVKEGGVRVRCGAGFLNGRMLCFVLRISGLLMIIRQKFGSVANIGRVTEVGV